LKTGRILEIQRFSMHDGPGIRTTVFLKGCPLRCWWCHNPESQLRHDEIVVRKERCIACRACEDACEQGGVSRGDDGPTIDRERCIRCGACAEVCYAEAIQLAGRDMTAAQLAAEIERDVAFFDQSGGGVTLSGGEPLAQPEFTAEVLQACRARGIHTAIETCGFAPWRAFEQVLPHVDLILYDVKLLDDAAHRQYTGVSNELILANLGRLAQEGREVVLRFPLVPGVNDAPDHVAALGRLAADLGTVRRIDILPYHHIATEKYSRLDRGYSLPDVRPPADEAVASCAHILGEFGLEVGIGG
jgi:pyruvate formate lyase activating enzyme